MADSVDQDRVNQAPVVIAGKYRLIEQLATGGMGTLWIAEHVQLRSRVVVKRPRDFRASASTGARFEREARAAAALVSRHIVRVIDFGVEPSGPYLVMDLLVGEDLSSLLGREGRLSPVRAWSWFEQLCRALQVAHDAGIVHRDIKPSNLFIAAEDGDEVLKVLDFGIARELRPSERAATLSGTLLGSPGYMSPEQARGLTADARSDLWSAAVVLYEMLTGHAPFLSDHPGDSIARICGGVYPAATELAAELPSSVNVFFARALQLNPERRYQDVRRFRAAAEQALLGRDPVDDSASDPGCAAASAHDRRPDRPPVPRARGRESTTATERAQHATGDGGLTVQGPPVTKPRTRSWLLLPIVAAAAVGLTYLVASGAGVPPPSHPIAIARATGPSATSSSSGSASGSTLTEPAAPASTAPMPTPHTSKDHAESTALANTTERQNVSATPPARTKRNAAPASQSKNKKTDETEATRPATASGTGARALRIDPFTGLPLESAP